jgi:microsomal epoxide hydrolase
MEPQPFTVAIEEPVLDDLKSRLRHARWPSDTGNENWCYGFNGDYLRSLADTWLNDFNWREVEREINGFDHYRVTIDGVPVHFIRKPGKGPRSIPLLINHGWPSTFWEMSRVIVPLADPAAFGGDPEDAFDVIVTSLPGFTFSSPQVQAGMTASRVADLWHRLMTEVLGYERYAVSGGDWGSRVTSVMGHKYAESLYGIHILGATPIDLFSHERYWDITASFVPYDAPEPVRKAILPFVTKAVSHACVQTLEPQTLSYAMHDSPVGQLAWITQRLRDWGHTHGDVESVFSREYLLTTATLYWVTETFVTSARYYRDAVLHPWQPSHNRQPRIEAPTGITFLGGEDPPGVTHENRVDMFMASARAKDYNLHYVKAHESGGHFGYYENPQACIDDIREIFRDLRK